MTYTIDRKSLGSALSFVAPAVSSIGLGTPKDFVRLRIWEHLGRSGLTLTASNDSLEMHIDVPCDSTDAQAPVMAAVLAPGSRMPQPQPVYDAMHRHHLLTQITARSEGAKLALAPGENDSLCCSTDQAEWHLDSADPSCFPTWPSLRADAYRTTMEAEPLATILRQCEIAVHRGTDNGTRFVVEEMLMHLSNVGVSAAATDGRRVAWAIYGSPPPPAGEGQIQGLVSRHSIAAFRRFADTMADPVPEITLAMDSHMIAAWTPSAHVRAKLGSGKFPPYREIIPKKVLYRIPMPREALLRACRQSRGTEKAGCTPTTFQFARSSLVMCRHDEAGHRSRVVMPLSEGPAASVPAVILDAGFLEQHLAVIADEQVIWEQAAVKLPVVIRSPSSMYLIQVIPGSAA